MKKKEISLKQQTSGLKHTTPWWSGLRFRMTISYALTSLATMLVVEILLGIGIWVVLTYTPWPVMGAIEGAQQSAKLYALAAAAQGGGVALDPRTTFEPQRAASILLPSTYFSNNSVYIPYSANVSASQTVPFMLLIAPDRHVVASSDPAQYPVTMSLAHVFARQSPAIVSTLAGKAGSGVFSTAQGNTVYAVEPVMGREGQVIGAVYVQIPTWSGAGALQGILIGVFFSAFFCLLITLPVGVVFGLITTRAVVHRLRRLVVATTRFAEGDYTQRVRVSRRDEVGQLEQHFNQMAGQLVESMEQRHILIEQNARQTERARIEQEMRTAQQIQMSLLPKEVPVLPGWQLTPYYKPANEVGGDFYDFITFDDGRVGIVIGDVTGKGMPAALIMAITRTMLRTAAQTTTSPGAVLARVNDLLTSDIAPGMFVTCFCALLNPASGQLLYANAGHDLPYRRHADGVAELWATGLPLGIMPGTCYDEYNVTLIPGDSILFYSDGLVEAHNTEQKMFGFPRLMGLMEGRRCALPLIDYLLGELATFAGKDWEQEDDVTMVVLDRIVPIEQETEVTLVR